MQAGGVYQWRARLHGDAGDVCLGADCFRLTFLLGTAVELLAMLLALLLYHRTRTLYSSRGERGRALPQAQDECSAPADEDVQTDVREPLLREHGAA
jgi:hypothetical protein